MSKKNLVIDEIRAAFAGVKLGDGIGLREAQALDRYADPETTKKARDSDEKDSWESISFAELERCHSSPCFFDAEGMRFHLPAFLIAALQVPGDWNLTDILFSLTDLDDSELGEYRKSRLTLLSTVQRAAVVRYLELLRSDPAEFPDYERLDAALMGYWSDI